MTNTTLPVHDASLATESVTLFQIGGKRLPVKLVEHPAFRGRAAARKPSAALRIPVVSLNRAAVPDPYPCSNAGSTIAMTSQEAV